VAATGAALRTTANPKSAENVQARIQATSISRSRARARFVEERGPSTPWPPQGANSPSQGSSDAPNRLARLSPPGNPGFVSATPVPLRRGKSGLINSWIQTERHLLGGGVASGAEKGFSSRAEPLFLGRGRPAGIREGSRPRGGRARGAGSGRGGWLLCARPRHARRRVGRSARAAWSLAPRIPNESRHQATSRGRQKSLLERLCPSDSLRRESLIGTRRSVERAVSRQRWSKRKTNPSRCGAAGGSD